MSTLPFLSVVIPTYNRCASLRVTLEALARQETVVGGFEVVVVSDGSTDGTMDLLSSLEPTLPYALHAIQQENGGPAKARNRGVRAARGQVVVFLDDDVEPLPGCLAAHAVHHWIDTKIVVIGPMSPDPALWRSEPCWIAWEHAMLQKQYDSWKSGVWREDECGPHNFYTGNASLRREHLLAVGGFDEGFNRQEDVEVAARMERDCGVFFRFDPKTDAIHRPRRTYESWRKTPHAYGSLDVVRAQRGDASWKVIQHGYHARNRVTQRCANWGLRSKSRLTVLENSLKTLACMAWKLPLPNAEKAALAALSVIYNVRYLEGARDQLGSWDRLTGVLGAQSDGVKVQETTA